MQGAGFLAMFLAVIGAVLAVTQLDVVAVSLLPLTSGLLNTVVAAMPYMALLMVPVILVFWITSKR